MAMVAVGNERFFYRSDVFGLELPSGRILGRINKQPRASTKQLKWGKVCYLLSIFDSIVAVVLGAW